MRDAALPGVALGFFDGVHLGHRAILKGADVAVTFRNHPLGVVAPDRAPRLIMSLADRLAAIRAEGVKRVLALPFTPELAHLPPLAFLDFLKAELGFPDGFVLRCGANARFGRNGEGSAAFLRERGFPVDVVPFAVFRGETVSSSRIRAALEAGAMPAAQAMLGRSFQVRGRVFSGKGEGCALGFPTVNLAPEDLALNLPRGVYAVRAGAARGVANFGRAPTFGDLAWQKDVFEVHFLDAVPPEATSGTSQTLSLLAFLRPERAFPTREELAGQIAEDCAQAERILRQSRLRGVQI